MTAKTTRARGSRARTLDAPAPSLSLPDTLLVNILACLPQGSRVRASEVCRAWREATLAPPLWRAVKLVLPCDDDEGTADAFLCWLQPRASAVESLSIDIQETAAAPNDYVVNTFFSLASALRAVAHTLRHLSIESAGQLTVGQWAADLRCLASACFIGSEVVLRPGLGKLPHLADLEFGSNSAELVIEGGAVCLPPSVTHLSLEHCMLGAVPTCITHLTQLRSLDLSQNTIVYEEGDETATLSRLTGLECLKLANCRMTEVPQEVSALRRLRILHMGGNLEGPEAQAQQGERLEATLRPLRNLQVLVVSQCNMQVPEAVQRMSRLERLFVTSTPAASLAPGAYCRSLRHLCVDWDVAFESAPMLGQCTALQMLTLARPLRSEQPDSQSDARARDLTAALLGHPTLQQVNLVAVAGRGLHLSIPTMRFLLALQSSLQPRLRLELIESWDNELVRIPSLLDFKPTKST